MGLAREIIRIFVDRCGFAGNSSPRHIIPTTVTIHGDVGMIDGNEGFDIDFDLDESCFWREFRCDDPTRSSNGIHSIDLLQVGWHFIRGNNHGLLRYNISNCRERRVVIVESVITPSRTRHLLADILLKQFEVRYRDRNSWWRGIHSRHPLSLSFHLILARHLP